MNEHITIGAPVYDMNGGDVGTVSDQTVPGQYLAVEKGVVLPGNIYVPMTAIRGTAPSGAVTLSLTEEELSDPAYNAPPATTAATRPDTMRSGAYAPSASAIHRCNSVR